MNLVSVVTKVHVEDQYPIAKTLTLATTQQPENMEQLPVLRAFSVTVCTDEYSSHTCIFLSNGNVTCECIGMNVVLLYPYTLPLPPVCSHYAAVPFQIFANFFA